MVAPRKLPGLGGRTAAATNRPRCHSQRAAWGGLTTSRGSLRFQRTYPAAVKLSDLTPHGNAGKRMQIWSSGADRCLRVKQRKDPVP